MLGAESTDDRARLTIVDVVLFLAAVAMIGALWPVVSWSLEGNAGELGTGEGYLFQLVLPILILVLLIRIWRGAILGGGTG